MNQKFKNVKLVYSREAVVSSNLLAVAYNRSTNIMTVWFKSGSVYRYWQVPDYKYESLLRAPSKGHYFYYNIRTSYVYERIG
jgi:isoleucyl-tRNA synthetase